MSIITQRGDDGHTDLMYGRRVPKTHPQVETYGNVDELNAALGLVRVAIDRHIELRDKVVAIQEELIPLMGELATAPEDYPRYEAAGYQRTTPAMVDRLTALGRQLEEDYELRLKDWERPGAQANLSSAFLDQARTVCRRCERQFQRLREHDPRFSETIGLYLNRLSDVCWLLARHADATEAKSTKQLPSD